MAAADSVPKLTYFDIRGLAELPRLLLAAGGVKYIDDRIPFTRNADGTVSRGDWSERKPLTPYGQVPIFEIRGTKIAQSAAIVRFIAREYHLDGDNELEVALVDAGYEAVLDIRRAYFTARGDEKKIGEFWGKGFGEALAFISNNIRGSSAPTAVPWFNGKRLTYVDVALYYLVWVLRTENKDAVEKALTENPKLQAIYDAVEKEPKIAAYLAQRKQTLM